VTLPAFPVTRLAAAAIFVALIAAVLLVSNSSAAPVLTTDKEDYFSNEIVPVTGNGFAPNTLYDIPIIRPDGSIVVGDGSFIPGWDSVTSDGLGDFTYLYQLNGIFGTYEVRAYVSPWNGNLNQPPVASMTFTDADINFQQCQNDNNNDDVIDACAWTNGGLNQNNSLYTEGDAPPQRLFHRLDEIGTHIFGFEYEFSKADIYAYDFITNADDTQTGVLLNECAGLPGFISATQCTDMFSTNVQFGAVPSDLFDSVPARENPPGAAARSFRVGCTPACSVGVSVEFPDPPTGPTDGEDNPGGEAHTPDSDPDCFKDCGSSDVKVTVTVTTTALTTRVGMWFAGHLAETADPLGAAIGWGTGCGATDCGSSSIAGAPFHIKYNCLQEPSDTSCDSVGNRDNQIQSGGVTSPGMVTIVKVADPQDPQDFSFTGDLGAFTLDDDGVLANPLNNSMTFTSLTAGTYDVTEIVTPGWSLTGIACTGDLDAGSVVTLQTVSIDVDADENITCTFTNVPSETDVKITEQTETAPASANINTNFTLAVDKTLHNNGPFGPVDVSITPTVSAPADCTVTPDPLNPTSATLEISTAVNVTENFTISCTNPSTHVFSVDNCIAITTAGVSDSSPANNCWPTQQVSVDVLATSDIKVTSVTASSPASNGSGSPFIVSATAILHNNSGYGPTNVDTTFTLNLPGDCSTGSANPATVQDTSLAVSTAVPTAPVSWSVTCTSPSSHVFTVTAVAAIDQQHVSDPNGANNSANDIANTAVTSTADLKVSSVTVTAPVSTSVGTIFVTTVTATVHNNGAQTPVNADATIGLSVPADCTATPTGGQDQQNVPLVMSTAANLAATWNVSCTESSNHLLDGTASVVVDELHVSDANGANNSGNANITMSLTDSTDLKVSSVTVTAPASAVSGVGFVVTVDAVLHNNGPETPVGSDATVGLLVPADCTATPTGGQDQQDLPLVLSTPTNVQATWNVSCTAPSNHQFDGTASVAADQLHVGDTNSANNSNSGNASTSITSTADLKVSSVTVSALASVSAGTPFTVTVATILHNNGPETPVNADASLGVSVPADCTATPTGGQDQQDLSLVMSAPTNVQATWSVTCSNSSNHQFDGSASVAVDQLHVSDPNSVNSSGGSNTTSAVTFDADLKVSSVSVNAPASATAGAISIVTVTATLHNNGPDTPVNADATISLSVPADCTATPTGGQDQQDVSLVQSTANNVQATWDVSCTDPSNHQFDGSATVAIDQLHVTDSNTANNSNNGNATTSITETADVKITSVSVSSPVSAGVGSISNVTVTATLHNNGPESPVNADASLGLSVPADCTATPTGGQNQQDVPLVQSTATNVQATWDVFCSNASSHQFDGSASVAIDQLHVSDPISINDSGNGNSSTAILSTIDLKVSSVSVSAPSSANANAPFVVTVTGTLHNNGPESPINADATLSLSVPADCTATPTGGQDQQDVSLIQSTTNNVQATWSVSCTDASDHQLDGSATVTVDQLHTSDAVAANDAGNANLIIVVGADADVKVSSVTVNAPANADAGSAFVVTVDAVIDNDGPTTPVLVDATITLSGPGDCTLTPTVGQDQQNIPLVQSVAGNIQATWSAVCTSSSNHQFDGTASLAIDALHLNDPNPLNDSKTGNDTISINETTDLKVTAVSVSAQASANTGATFAVTVTATVHNNGTATPVDGTATIGLSVPADCTATPTGGQSQPVNGLVQSTAQNVPATWDVQCSTSSNHQLDGSASIAVNQLHITDTTPGNDSNTGNTNISINGGADIKVSSVSVTVPPFAAAGATFGVTVTATLHNNGPESPVSANVAIGLAVPGDCTATPTGGQAQSPSLVQSTATPIQATWDVSCTNESNHLLDGSASVSVNQLHVIDPIIVNNSGNGANTISITANADLKVSSVTVSAPAAATVGAAFNVTVDAALHNNGAETPVNADATIGLAVPGDCTATPTGGQAHPDKSLSQSVASNIQGTWSVTCSGSSNHQFDGTASVVVDQLHVSDPNSANNSGNGSDITPISGTADIKVSGITVDAPTQVAVNTPFDVTVAATLHNNGTATPVNVDTTIALSTPGDCVLTPAGSQILNDTSLAQSTTKPVQAIWSVTCASHSNHQFDGSASVAIDQLHTTDPTPGNDSGNTSDNTVVIATGDLKANSVTLVVPGTVTANVPFNVTATADFHNNGPPNAANVDVTLTLTLPPGCSTLNANPVVLDDIVMNVSVPTTLPSGSPATWSVTCSSGGAQSFTVVAEIFMDTLHVVDPQLANNTATTTEPPGNPGGTPVPVGGIVGLLDAPDEGPRSEAQSGGITALLIALAVGATVAIAGASVWISRVARRP